MNVTVLAHRAHRVRRRVAVTRFIEGRTGWSIRKFVHTARRYRTVQIRAAATSTGNDTPTGRTG